MTTKFLIRAIFAGGLFAFITTARTAIRGKSARAHASPTTKFCMLCVAGGLALGLLTGCGGEFLYLNGGHGGGTSREVATPAFNPAPGSYTSAQTVTIGDRTPGATIYYTTDGTIPTASSRQIASGAAVQNMAAGITPAAQSAVYSGPITVAANETIEALAVEPGDTNSVVGLAAYTINPLGNGAPTVENCNGGILPAGNVDTDLQINGVSCTVNAGTYVYRNVNIWGGGSLNFADAKINFHAHSILVENGGSLIAGGSAPAAGPITIWLYGSLDDGIPEITCQSSATCGVPQDIWDSNPSMAMKMPQPPGAKCNPASKYPEASPVGSDCFYQYDVLDTDAPTGSFFSRKSLALSYGGTIYLRGAKGIRQGPIAAAPSDSGTSWVRLTTPLKGGKSSFTVDRPVPTWESGDHIVLTSTDYLMGHNEEAVIQSVASSGTGSTIALESPVEFPHNGATYNFSSLPKTSGPQDDPNRPATLPSRNLETRAAVALLTRSIMIASEGAAPVLSDRTADHFLVSDGFYGGQTIMRQGLATYQAQGVEFYHLGQGGVIGRYPVHFHMDRKVPQPSIDPPFDGTYIADSSIHDSMTRFITVHATQGLMILRNVGYRSIGHGFYLEDATEINNKLYSNIGIESRAGVDDALNPRKAPGILARVGESGAEVFPFHSDYDHPAIFWLTNGWNDLRYNVAVGAGTCGACYWLPPSINSGPSVYETWDSYASMQTNGRGGLTPIENFVGNSCSTAMNSIETVGNTSPCLAVAAAGNTDTTKLTAIANPNPLPNNKYPQISADGWRSAPARDRMSECSDSGERLQRSANLLRNRPQRGRMCSDHARPLRDLFQLGAEKFRRRLASRMVVSLA